jgi:hypothetical protein
MLQNISSILTPCNDAASGKLMEPCTVNDQYEPYKPANRNVNRIPHYIIPVGWFFTLQLAG